MKFLPGLLVFLMLVVMVPANAAEKRGDQPMKKAIWRKEKLTYQGMPREYWLYLPVKAQMEGARPALVLMLHGGGGRATQFDRLVDNRLKPLADRDGTVLVYPQAYKRQWNDGRGVVSIPAHAENIDDVGFIRTLIGEVSARYDVNPRRVYSGGISNGGMMSARLACELSDRIAAVALVASSMPEALSRRCRPSSPVSMLIINGTDDPLVPYEGGSVTVGRRTHGEVLSTPEAARYWAKTLGFDPDHQPIRRTLVADTAPRDGTRVERVVYPGRGPSEVILYVIEGGGHTWPKGRPYLPSWMVGRVSQELDATPVIWEFFRNHPKP